MDPGELTCTVLIFLKSGKTVFSWQHMCQNIEVHPGECGCWRSFYLYFAVLFGFTFPPSNSGVNESPFGHLGMPL